MPRAGNKCLAAVQNIMVAIAYRARTHGRRIRSGTRFGQAIACHHIHPHERRQKFGALAFIAKTVDHPACHIVNGQIGRSRSAARRQSFKNQRGLKPAQPRPAIFLTDIDAGKTKLGKLAAEHPSEISFPRPISWRAVPFLPSQNPAPYSELPFVLR